MGEEVEKLRAERDEAIRLMSEYARKLGEMEGRYKAAHWPGIVDEWKARAEAAEAELERVERLHGAACERLADYNAEIGSQTARAHAAEAQVEVLRSALEGTLKLLANFQVSGPAVKVARAALDAPPEPVSKAEEFATPAEEFFAENAKKSARSEQPSGEEFLEFKEALSDIRSLRQEHRDLSGGGPGWVERNRAAWARVDELFAAEDEAAYDRQQESFYG